MKISDKIRSIINGWVKIQFCLDCAKLDLSNWSLQISYSWIWNYNVKQGFILTEREGNKTYYDVNNTFLYSQFYTFILHYKVNFILYSSLYSQLYTLFFITKSILYFILHYIINFILILHYIINFILYSSLYSQFYTLLFII